MKIASAPEIIGGLLLQFFHGPRLSPQITPNIKPVSSCLVTHAECWQAEWMPSNNKDLTELPSRPVLFNILLHWAFVWLSRQTETLRRAVSKYFNKVHRTAANERKLADKSRLHICKWTDKVWKEEGEFGTPCVSAVMFTFFLLTEVAGKHEVSRTRCFGQNQSILAC